MRKSPKTQVARTPFRAVAEALADALADMYRHNECPEYLRVKIEEFHNGVCLEYRAEVDSDIRLRFAVAAEFSAIGGRPA